MYGRSIVVHVFELKFWVTTQYCAIVVISMTPSGSTKYTALYPSPDYFKNREA